MREIVLCCCSDGPPSVNSLLLATIGLIFRNGSYALLSNIRSTIIQTRNHDLVDIPHNVDRHHDYGHDFRVGWDSSNREYRVGSSPSWCKSCVLSQHQLHVSRDPESLQCKEMSMRFTASDSHFRIIKEGYGRIRGQSGMSNDFYVPYSATRIIRLPILRDPRGVKATTVLVQYIPSNRLYRYETVATSIT